MIKRHTSLRILYFTTTVIIVCVCSYISRTSRNFVVDRGGPSHGHS